jgi:hypothetical protein
VGGGLYLYPPGATAPPTAGATAPSQQHGGRRSLRASSDGRWAGQRSSVLGCGSSGSSSISHLLSRCRRAPSGGPTRMAQGGVAGRACGSTTACSTTALWRLSQWCSTSFGTSAHAKRPPSSVRQALFAILEPSACATVLPRWLFAQAIGTARSSATGGSSRTTRPPSSSRATPEPTWRMQTVPSRRCRGRGGGSRQLWPQETCCWQVAAVTIAERVKLWLQVRRAATEAVIDEAMSASSDSYYQSELSSSNFSGSEYDYDSEDGLDSEVAAAEVTLTWPLDEGLQLSRPPFAGDSGASAQLDDDAQRCWCDPGSRG